MITQAQARILLADNRPVSASHTCSTRMLEVPWAGLKPILFQEVTLAAREEFACKQPEGVSLVLPLVGNVHYIDGNNTELIEVGKGLGIAHKSGNPLEIRNSYTQHPINFLIIHLSGNSNLASERFVIKPIQVMNQLDLIFLSSANGVNTEFFLGQFEGRQEGHVHALGGSEFFVFVLGGAFEVQNRLLEKRDALQISAHDKLEFEALSQVGIVLVMRQSK